MKKLTMLLLALLFIFSASACSNRETIGPKANEETKEERNKTVLRFASWDSGEALKIQEEIAKRFEEINPNVKVQVEAYGEEFDQKLATSFGTKNPPDVLYMWNFPAYFQSLEPLDQFVNNDSELDLNDFYQGLFNYSSMYGKLYGIPAGFTTRVVYFNKDLFDIAGMPYPEEGWTWDDFQAAAEKLTVPSEKQYGFGIRPEPDTYDLQGFIWSNESSFISEDGKEVEGYMNSPETIEAINVFADMLKDKSAVLVGGKNQQSGEEFFKEGKIAMWETGIWPLEEFKEAKVNFGTVEMPAFSGKSVKGVIASSAVSIAKDSKNKELAWEFVKFYSSAEAIKRRTADLPVRISVVKDIKTEEDPLIKPFYKMLERSNDTPAFHLNKNWDEINRNLSSAINAIMLEQDAETLLNKAVKDSEIYLK
ncbi:sugar ABC transporter substrate-binding protein [Bacillus sp. FJAT-18017]|uniref:ABC transporter substrate-binding protein n=1 Tax=Bacillus sp. FJAT-18017 TaxID=1705566 RepID=UPI0006B007C6|nr:sugar ABC transporter substrate-binding protein [Bacillus sp. FJAT-18017]ALC91425.1 sugar ABC transporter substrate-binding protein [Bacillus sp. FJAT-18017]